MIGFIEILVIAGVASAAVWWWQRRRELRIEETKPVADLSTINLVGVTGVLDEQGEDVTTGQIRLRDHSGVERILPAQVEDADLPLELGDEVLVIQNPTPYALMVVVPNELPRLEDLPK